MGYVVRNDARKLYHHATPGLDVRLGGDWQGVDVGWSELTVLGVAAVPSSRASRASGYAPPLGWELRDNDGTQRWLGWIFVDAPTRPAGIAFVDQFHAGVSVQSSRTAKGFSIGIERASVLDVDSRTDGIHLLEYSSRQPESARLIKLEDDSDD